MTNRETGLAIDRRLANFGVWLRDHQGAIRRVQWLVVAFYISLLAIPLALPLPDGQAHILTNVTILAQFLFWGIWWPFVLLSMFIVGRAWCGLLCPEGTLSEAASSIGRGRALPQWLKWKGWPFAAFALTTVYGQLVSVYQYPKPAALILGGSTAAAITIGYLYGRNKRAWCRYLCPVNGVFGMLSKLAPIHFVVDNPAWHTWKKPRGSKPETVNCAPLVVLSTLNSSAPCHVCGRCAGFRGAISLQRRSPNAEIVDVSGLKSDPWETALIIFGLIGIGGGAFHWSDSPLLVSSKQIVATWLVEHKIVWPLEPLAPWWMLTNYPEQNDMLSPLDGVLLVGYIALFATLLGLSISTCLALTVRLCGTWRWARFHHLAQSLIPIAGCTVFLGLSSLTVTMLHNEALPLPSISVIRAILLLGATLWSFVLAIKIMRRWECGGVRLSAAACAVSLSVISAAFGSFSLFWHFIRI
jgi:polyferredoxin